MKTAHISTFSAKPNGFSLFLEDTLQHVTFSIVITSTLMLIINFPKAQWVMLLIIPSVPLKNHTQMFYSDVQRLHVY